MRPGRSLRGPPRCGLRALRGAGLPREAQYARGGLFGPLERNDLGRRRFGDERAQQLVVERMAGLVRAEGAEQRLAKQVKVADGIEKLVTDELVREAQAFGIQHAELIEHHGIVEAAAER